MMDARDVGLAGRVVAEMACELQHHHAQDGVVRAGLSLAANFSEC